ncbi:MAG: metalloprotease, partial [Flavobacteriaceae bacterium]|nr:metalloprotease [Flavobacteriaceae bacterium]
MLRAITSVLCLISLLLCDGLFSQHAISINAELDSKEHLIQIRQKIVYNNNSNSTLDTIYFLDWANAFSKKTTPLAKRFAENFQSNFHFERSHNRGRTFFHSISNDTFETLQWKRGEQLDIIKAIPEKPIAPGESYTFHLIYEVKLPDAKFTRFGHLKNGDYNLKHWFISPAVFDGTWKHYSHKNLNDYYMPPSALNIHFKAPEYYQVTSDLNLEDEVTGNGFKTTYLQGENRNSATIYLQQENAFEVIITDDVEVHTSIDDKGLYPPLKAIQIDRIIKYLESELGPYPFQKMVISDEDYKLDPAYGLNQLPSFIRPFPDGFQYDIEQLKTISGVFIKNTLNVNPRDEHWLLSSLQIYLMMKYTDIYYPDMKIVGNLSRVWGLRWLHAAQLNFNDQYPFLYLNSARLNIDQALSTPLDSLIKFNAEIASGYKGGVGLNYLNQYLGENILSESLKEFYEENALKLASAERFENIIKSKTDKNIDWFFEEYVGSNQKLDYKISHIKKENDSIQVTIKNNSKNSLPF